MKFEFKKKYFFLVFLFLVVLYLFWGPLFPWSPIKIGYKKIESSKATVYIADLKGESVACNLDEILQEEETFHDLEFKEKFKIIVLDKESNMKRYLPWLKGSGYSVKLGFVNVIYIGPTARNSQYGIEVYLKHEMSHILIHQNVSSAENNFEIQKQGWLAEGVATYFGGPHFYEKNEFVELWKENGLTFNSLHEGNPLKFGSSFTLKYTYYRFFIEFLIETYGIEKFQAYLKSYINNPPNYKLIFPDIYDADLEKLLKDFSTYIYL